MDGSQNALRRAAAALLATCMASGLAHASEISGRVEMPELCSPAVSPAVVWLEPLDQKATIPTIALEPRFIDQRGLMFEPRIVAMRIGETLRFGNADSELHNVHIQGKDTSFNQGVPAGETVAFVPRQAGILRVLCDVHTHMRAFVVVGETPWISACSRTGRFRFEDVPEGHYRLRIWHEMGAPASRELEVKGNGVDVGSIAVNSGLNPSVVDESAKVCEKGCEPWPLVIDRIAVTLASSMDAAQRPDSAAKALPLVEDAQYRDFESSGMGTAIRVHLGRERAAKVDDIFRTITKTTIEGHGSDPEVLGETRQALLTLAQASEDLNKKGVTERSRMFAGTSPAFWVEDAPEAVKTAPARFDGLTLPLSLIVAGLFSLALLFAWTRKRRPSPGAMGLPDEPRPAYTGSGEPVAPGKRLALGATGSAEPVPEEPSGCHGFSEPVLEKPPPVSKGFRGPMPPKVIAAMAVLLAVTGTYVVFAFRSSSPTPSPTPRSGPRATFSKGAQPVSPATPSSTPATSAAPLAREHPIDREVARNHLRIAALWHRPVQSADGPPVAAGKTTVHLLARIEAAEGNPNGFARGDWVPYLGVRYTLTLKDGGPPLSGVLRPVLAADGPRYGANLTLPGPGDYQLTYRITPPADDTLTRLVDPTDGVAPWWAPFTVDFAWTFRP
jgi:periplasmic iron binding protein